MSRHFGWWLLVPLGLGLAALALVVAGLHVDRVRGHPSPTRSPHAVTASPSPHARPAGDPPVTVVVVPSSDPRPEPTQTRRPRHHEPKPSTSPSPRPTDPSPTPCGVLHPLRCLVPTILPEIP